MPETRSQHNNQHQDDIAIIGMASHFPEAATLHQFWQNIISKKDALSDISTMPSDEYWKKEEFYHPDPTKMDKTYAYKAGFVPAIDFDPMEFKIPPAILDSISAAQLFSLHVAKQAMIDAGLLSADNQCHNRERTGVILGGSGNGNTSFSLATRLQSQFLREIMVNSGLSQAVAEEIIERINNLCLEWNEDSFPGFLGNVVCGRIASHFDLGGASYMVDAACASSLAAIKAAMNELHSGSCDVVLTGGVNLENSAFAFLCFSKTPALAKSNQSKPFDRDSDGIMLGDGLGFLVLKRLTEAKRDNDRIYAVIKAIEASSDGKAKSIFAPRDEGQIKAIKRTYAQAGLSPADVQLIEAHGTGTPSGDNVEIKSLLSVFAEHPIAAQSVAIGSIKSQIGHTRCAAGAASMIKVALALHHKVLPPTINVNHPIELLSKEEGPFYINHQARPWVSHNHTPRRAALSAFGFGGTNFHAILEEYRPEPDNNYRLNNLVTTLLIYADTPDALLAECEKIVLQCTNVAAANLLHAHLVQQNMQNLQSHHARLLLVVNSEQQAVEFLKIALAQLQQTRTTGWQHPLGIYYQPAAQSLSGKIVALFPGQGSQYLNMARDIANDYPPMRQSLETLDKCAINARGHTLSAIIYPPCSFSQTTHEKQQARLSATANTQPAIGAVSAGYFNLLKENGFKPDFIAGHSYGEITALWAAGVLAHEDFYAISLARGATTGALAENHSEDCGAMLGAALSLEQRLEVLKHHPGITLANDNSPSQAVFGGTTVQIQQLCDELKNKKIHCQILPVSAAFHTQFMQKAYKPFYRVLKKIHFQAPQYTLFSSATAAPYSDAQADFADTLAKQLTTPVRFRETIEAIYQQGGRLFVEIGPKNILSKRVAEILKGKEHYIIAVNPKDNGQERLQLAQAQAQLLALGVKLSAFDQYAQITPPLAAKAGKLTFKLSGGFFLLEKNKLRRNYALRTGDTHVVDQFIASHIAKTQSAAKTGHSDHVAVLTAPRAKTTESLHSLPPNISVAIQKRDNTMEQKSHLNTNQEENSLTNLLQAQLVMSQLHEQFQINQKEYLQLLSSLLNKQYALIEQFPDNQNLALMLGSLNQSAQLIDKNLTLYHSNHERYFATQQSLLQFSIGNSAASNVLLQPLAGNNEYALAPAIAPIAATASNAPAIFTDSAPSSATQAAIADVTKPQTNPQQPITSYKVLTQAEITAQLIAIVSEQTGYPQEMIGEDMDLEAALGIDSIKRFEIFGAMLNTLSQRTGINDALPKNHGREHFDIETLNNIQKMSGFFKQLIDEAISKLQPKSAIPPTAEKNHTFSQQQNTHVGNSLVANTSQGDEPLHALGFIASTGEINPLKKPLAESQHAVTPQAVIQPHTQPEIASEHCAIARFIVATQPLPQPEHHSLVFNSCKLWLLFDEGSPLIEHLINLLTQHNQRCIVLSSNNTAPKQYNKIDPKQCYGLNQLNESALDNIISQIESQHGDINAVIYLQAARKPIKTAPAAFDSQEYHSIETLFLLAKCLNSSLNQRNKQHNSYFFVITRGDGTLSSSTASKPQTVIAAGVSGLTKSLNREWQNTFCRTVDIDSQISAPQAAQIIIEELQDSDSNLAEVGRKGKQQRITLALVPAPTPAVTPLPFNHQDIILVSGGARGITARCVIEMAKCTKAQFILLGRRDLTAPLPLWAQNCSDESEYQAAAIGYLKAQNEHATPVQIAAMINAVKQINEIKHTLCEMQQIGAKAHYFCCDITDSEQVAATLAQINNTFGPVSCLIHAAGNLADKRIERKTLADLHWVLDAKVKGLANLCNGLDFKQLRYLMLFSSVAGYLGNTGQTDYAVANEILNKFAHLCFKQNSSLVVRAINWGPWDGGMVNDALKRNYQAQNMLVIPEHLGTHYFLQEFSDTQSRQVVIGDKHYGMPRVAAQQDSEP